MRQWILIMMFIFFISSPAWADMYFVQQVINGNTLRLITGETVRLIGVDIPEITADMSMQEKARIINNQQKAAEYVRRLVSGTKVDLQFDSSKRDADDNILAYAWFLYPEENVKQALKFENDYKWNEIVEDWGEHQYITFLNAAIIKAGFAVPKDNHTNTQHSVLFNNIYQEKRMPTMQAMGTTGIDLTKVIP